MDKIMIAIYLRISNEDSGKSEFEESNSISAQRALLMGHIGELMKGQAYSITEFCDDGYSGTDFNRPGVQAMLEAAKSGSINMVIVKDLSRFGRDYLEVGRFLEYIFPILQIRFVSVNDGYDSDDKFGISGGMGVALKNLIYGMYSADLSKKVRTARDTRVRNGEFVGPFAPYGYMKNPENKHELLIDESVSWVVRKIFHLAADGVSHTEIARQLNEEGIPTRYMYHQLKGDNFPDRQPHVKIKIWDNTAVRDIITDGTYLGTMFWNRAKCGMDTNKKEVCQPKEEWIIVENHHEAIVSRELFQKANDNIVGRNSSKKAAGKKNLFFICGYCGKGLQLRKGKNGRYYCMSRTQQIKNECQRISIKGKELEDAVLHQVRAMADALAEERNAKESAYRDDGKAVLETTVANNEREMARWKDTKMRLYEQYKAGTITREIYVARIEKGRTRMEELEKVKNAALEKLDSMQAVPGMEKIPDEELVELSALESFDKNRLKALIDKVVVYGADAIEIMWKVDNPFQTEITA
ncbi:MAG: recombinase family protein [Lachnospiraceae bacterium]|nr:recombinase family protein [Lachnospiraceae bacterium]